LLPAKHRQDRRGQERHDPPACPVTDATPATRAGPDQGRRQVVEAYQRAVPRDYSTGPLGPVTGETNFSTLILDILQIYFNILFKGKIFLTLFTEFFYFLAHKTHFRAG
jgi:hypothetical protein